MNRAISRLLVMVATFVMGGALLWIYEPGFTGEFVFDDNPAIVENESIRQLFPLWGTTERAGPLIPQLNTPLTARPLVNLSFALNYHFGVMDPWGYRLVQVILHWMAALLLWRLGFQVLSRSSSIERSTGTAAVVSFAGAMLWAIHPLNTETVNYVTQRTELLMAVFYFGCLLACWRYFVASGTLQRTGWLLLVVLTGWCGILCKETMSTIPAVVLLGHWLMAARNEGDLSIQDRLGTFLRRECRRSWPVYAALVSCWLPIALIYRAGYVTPGGGFGNSIGAVEWWWTQCEVVFLYLRLAVWPSPLLVHYNFPIHEGLADAWPFVVGCLVWIVTSLWLTWIRHWTGFVMLTVLILLSPTLLIPLPGETVAERRMYLPLAGMTMWFAAAVFDFIRRHASVQNPLDSMRPLPAVWTVVMTIPLIAFLLVSHARVPAYRTQFSIWHDNMIHHPTDHLSWMNVGAMLAESGQMQMGMPFLERAVQLNPKHERSRFNLARAYESQGRIDEAITHYQAANRLDPAKYSSAYNLARIYEQQGEVDKAIELYEEVCETRPDFMESHVNLGILLVSGSNASAKNRLQDAIGHFRVAVDLDASDDNFINLMLAYQMDGRYIEAMSAAKKGLAAAKQENDRRSAAELERAIRGLKIAASR